MLMAVGLLPFPAGLFDETAQATAYSASMDASKGTLGRADVLSMLDTRSVSFEENRGQADPSVRFLARTAGIAWFFAETEVVMVLAPPKNDASLPPSVIRMKFVASNAAPTMIGTDEVPGFTNYFVGNDPTKWATGVSSFARIAYVDLYPGIDLVFYSTAEGQLEYDVSVAPGADPRDFQWSIDGADPSLTDAGLLFLGTVVGGVAFEAPVLYQVIAGEKLPVDGRFALGDSGLVSFEVGDYETSETLVIDPLLAWSTLLGGTANDGGRSIATDSFGNAYATGYTDSADFDFPLAANPYQPATGGGTDVFVSKFSPTGTRLWTTYFGGNGLDGGRGVAVDAFDSAYVTGETTSSNFPTTDATTNSGLYDAFAAKFSSAGSLLWATLLGGTADDGGRGVAVDSANNAYVAGYSSSTNFPTRPLGQTANAGNYDIFVAKLDGAGGALAYSTLLGGTSGDQGMGVAVGASGTAYVTGRTFSTDVIPSNSPTTVTFQQASNGGGDAFVAGLSASGSVAWFTYLGGTAADEGLGIATDGGKNVYVTGWTTATGTASTDFPTLGAYQGTHGGAYDAFFSTFSDAGALVYSTFLGGPDTQYGNAVAVGPDGNAYVTGEIWTTAIPPSADAYQASNSGFRDAFVAQFVNPSTTGTLGYFSYLGGFGHDWGLGIALDSGNNLFVTGETDTIYNPYFPTTANAHQVTNKGLDDAFVTKFGNTPVTPPFDPCDKNHDGTVDAAEAAFCACDTNMDGFLSPQEALRCKKDCGPCDTNQDGTVNGAELAACAKKYKPCDTNLDGMISGLEAWICAHNPCDTNWDGTVSFSEKMKCLVKTYVDHKLKNAVVRPPDEVVTRIDDSGIWALLEGALSSGALKERLPADVRLDVNVRRATETELSYTAIVEGHEVVSIATPAEAGTAKYTLTMDEPAALSIINAFDRGRTASLLFAGGFLAVNGASQADKIALKGLSSDTGSSLLNAQPYAAGVLVTYDGITSPLVASSSGGGFHISFGKKAFLVDAHGGRVGYAASEAAIAATQKVTLTGTAANLVKVNAMSGATTNSKEMRMDFVVKDPEMSKTAAAFGSVLAGRTPGNIGIGTAPAEKARADAVFKAAKDVKGAGTGPPSAALPCVKEEPGTTVNIFDRWGNLKANGFALGAAATETVKIKLCGPGLTPAPIVKGAT